MCFFGRVFNAVACAVTPKQAKEQVNAGGGQCVTPLPREMRARNWHTERPRRERRAATRTILIVCAHQDNYERRRRGRAHAYRVSDVESLERRRRRSLEIPSLRRTFA